MCAYARGFSSCTKDITRQAEKGNVGEVFTSISGRKGLINHSCVSYAGDGREDRRMCPVLTIRHLRALPAPHQLDLNLVPCQPEWVQPLPSGWGRALSAPEPPSPALPSPTPLATSVASSTNTCPWISGESQFSHWRDAGGSGPCGPLSASHPQRPISRRQIDPIYKMGVPHRTVVRSKLDDI